jgi:hypothetical protein
MATCQRGELNFFRIPALVWRLTETYSLNMANSVSFFLKYDDLGSFLHPNKKPLYKSQGITFCWHLAKINFTTTRNTAYYVLRPTLYKESRPMFNSNQHSYWCKNWNQPQGLYTRSQGWNRKNLFNLPQVTNECWTLWPCNRPKAQKRIPSNLGSQFATPGANVPAFINILTSML